MSYHDVRNKLGRFTSKKGKAAVGKVAAKKAAKIVVAADQTEDQAIALANQLDSFNVNFIRAKDLDGKGGVKANKNNPSKRRFATEKEARQHGTRFTEIQGHLGFYVTHVDERPTAWINWETGLTNPEL